MANENLLHPRDAAKFIADKSRDVKILPNGVKTASEKVLLHACALSFFQVKLSLVV